MRSGYTKKRNQVKGESFSEIYWRAKYRRAGFVPPGHTHIIRELLTTMVQSSLLAAAVAIVSTSSSHRVECFAPTLSIQSAVLSSTKTSLHAKKKANSGGGGFGSSATSKKKAPRGKSGRSDLLSALNDDDSKKKKKESTSFSRTFVKTEQEDMLNDLAAKSSTTAIGKAVAKSPYFNTPEMDPFWQLLPSLISTKFPTASDKDMERVAGMIEFSIGAGKVEDDVVENPWRPHTELHAYMPGLGETQPFLDPDQLNLCKQLSENYDVISSEYAALLEERFDRKGNDRFQSVTSMNYEAGWKTMVLFYNGHRIKDFPYHLCPVTTKIMESVPIAGRIAGFNRQQPQSG